MDKFLGREEELKILEGAYKSSESQIVVVYGRRRVGKSALINKFLESKTAISVEGLENKNSKSQIKEFTKAIYKYNSDPLLKKTSQLNWGDLFDYLSENVLNKSGKKIIFLDEFQWLACNRSTLVALLKSYWDRNWSKQNVLLILCGSIASFMVNKVIHSKALYGRINQELLLKGLKPNQSLLFFKNKRNKFEVLKYLLIFGGIPKYLEEIKLNQDFETNIENLCFRPNGFMFNEAEKIFYNQFREAKTYIIIIKSILDRALSFNQISQKLKISSGGSLKLYLDNLENSEIIKSSIPFNKPQNSKLRKYRLSDEYLIFFYKFIEPKQKLIKEEGLTNLFETTVANKWQGWLGFAFERFCVKNAIYLAKQMGFASKVINLGPWYRKEDEQFQIDLVYELNNKTLVICEVKYTEAAVGTKIIPEMEHKIKLINMPKDYTLQKALISPYGIDRSLKDSEYFDYIVTIDDIF